MSSLWFCWLHRLGREPYFDLDPSVEYLQQQGVTSVELHSRTITMCKLHTCWNHCGWLWGWLLHDNHWRWSCWGDCWCGNRWSHRNRHRHIVRRRSLDGQAVGDGIAQLPRWRRRGGRRGVEIHLRIKHGSLLIHG